MTSPTKRTSGRRRMVIDYPVVVVRQPDAEEAPTDPANRTPPKTRP